MLNGVLHLSIEIGPRCNLRDEHSDHCPAARRCMDGRPMMEPERIAGIIRVALELGFSGYVGFHWYNEPTLYPERIAEVIDLVPEARYMLITNGAGPIDPRFAWVYPSPYGMGDAYPWDTRLDNYTSMPHEPVACWRPLVECAIDNTGRMALCCQDWRMTASPVDVASGDVFPAFRAWRKQADDVSRGVCPPVCRTCTGAQDRAEYVRLLTNRGVVPA